MKQKMSNDLRTYREQDARELGTPISTSSVKPGSSESDGDDWRLSQVVQLFLFALSQLRLARFLDGPRLLAFTPSLGNKSERPQTV